MTTVLICDERREAREGLTRAMSAVPHVNKIDCVATAEDLLLCFARHPADIVLVGAQPGRAPAHVLPAARSTARPQQAADVVRRLVEIHPAARVLVFGGPDCAASAALAIAAGGCGFLRWNNFRAPASGPTSVLAAPPVEKGAGVGLTEREQQVLLGMSQGKSNGQIGRELFLSEDTIKTHARRLFRKLGVHDRAQAVAHAFRLELVS